jgi:ABC-type lipoprotein release transport system permease subunit
MKTTKIKTAFALWKTAYRNLVGAGLRSWLNVIVLSFSFVLIVWMQGLLEGWNRQSQKDTKEWQIGGGQYWQQQYDQYDPLSLLESHDTIPTALKKEAAEGKVTPILIAQGNLYSQGRMQGVMLKGIDPKQKILKLPTAKLDTVCTEIPVIVGAMMAHISNLKKGDVVTLRWRDKNGTFEAQDIVIADIFQANVPAVEAGQIWLPIERLREMLLMPDEATMLVISPELSATDIKGWTFKSAELLTEEVAAIIKTKTTGMSIFYFILLMLALIAIFDTQVLAIFRRQKEIGTFVALGMTQRQVVWMFTIEGAMYAILAVVLGTIYGLPLLIWQSISGFAIPMGNVNIGVPMSDVLYPYYGHELVIGTAILIIVITTVVSYFPARKIAKMNPTDAIRGKVS